MIEEIAFHDLADSIKQKLLKDNLLKKNDPLCLVADGGKGILLANVQPLYDTLSIYHLQAESPIYQLKLLEHAKTLPYSSLLITYLSKEIELESLLKEEGWSGPRKQKIFCYFDSYTFCPPWFDKAPPIDEPYTLFPWSEIKESEKEEIARGIKEMAIPEDITPLEDEETIYHQNSLGVKYKGDVIGWMITHKLPTSEIAYSSFYIDKMHRNKKVAMRLLQESIERQKRTPDQYSVCEVNLLTTDKIWHDFLEKNLVPYAYKIEYNHQMWL